MKKSTLYCSLFVLFLCELIVSKSSAQFTFTNSNTLIPTASHSGCAVTVVDINDDGLDDIVKMDQSTTLIVELQNLNGTFTHYNLGNITGTAKVWGMAVADVDHNGWKDVATGANGAMHLVKLSWTGSTIAATNLTLAGSYFVQNITFGDFNNDGWADLSVCDDNAYDKIYQNDGVGNLTLSTSLINTYINPNMFYGSDPYDSGNYGSVWTDFDNDGDLDLYIAHCRQSTSSSTDQRRRDRLFVNNGSNVFTEEAQSFGIEVADFKQTWTTSFGDMDNDGDLDIVMTNHGENSQILRNDGTGHFTDVTAGSGLSVPFDAIESVVEDFDNDGFLDILISGPSWVMYHNNGNGTYTGTPGVFAGSALLSFGIGDLNHDGKIDVFASYGSVYNQPTGTADVLYMNTTNTPNHFITFDLKGTTSNIGAIGARVTIYGPWGKQIREVRAGESYGTSNSMQLHFGLGSASMVDSARIDWPSHLQTHFTNLAANQFVTAVEGGCTITGNVIPGPYSQCSAGQNVTLSTTGNFVSYSWSTGDVTPTTTVSTPGFYNVVVTDANGCTNISQAVNVQLSPNQTPTISTQATDLNICQGSSVTLTSSYAPGYLWSNGDVTMSTTITQSGTYTVTITGDCQNWTSAPISVNVYPAPAPSSTNVTLTTPGVATLNATGNSISWYDVPVGGTPLATGPSYSTPFLWNSQTFYVEDSYSYGGATDYAGQLYHTGTSLYTGTTTNANELFDVLRPCVLKKVKVYTNTAGNRRIELRDGGGTVLQSVLVNIPVDTSLVVLNFNLAPGTGYQLGTNGAQNISSLGFASPQLMRSSSGVSYPYTINNFLTITNSDQGSTRYYYFYNWEVEELPTICNSVRVPVVVTVPLGVQNISNDNHIRVYPNPANKILHVSFDENIGKPTTIKMMDVAGRVVSESVYEQLSAGQTIQLDVNKLAAGTYMLTVKNENSSFTRSISIMQ